jgi:hypothetical protein
MIQPQAHEALIWTDEQREPLVRRVLEKMDGLQILALGGPRKGRLNDLAAKYGCVVEDDIRKMLIEQPASYLFLATDEGVSREDLAQARRAQIQVLAIEPPAEPLDQIETDRGRDEAMGRLFVVPWWRTSPVWQSAADPQEALGSIWAIQATSLCNTTAGSLYGRLYDTLDMIVNMVGMPDTVDASLAGPLGEPPQKLCHLTGALTAHLRFGGGGSAVIHVSDQSGQWSRRLEIIGADGQLRLTDDAYHLFSGGAQLDAHQSDDGPADASQLIASQWQRLILHAHAPTPVDAKAVVACSEAILLSCRTGHGESPTTMLRIHGAT